MSRLTMALPGLTLSLSVFLRNTEFCLNTLREFVVPFQTKFILTITALPGSIRQAPPLPIRRDAMCALSLTAARMTGSIINNAGCAEMRAYHEAYLLSLLTSPRCPIGIPQHNRVEKRSLSLMGCSEIALLWDNNKPKDEYTGHSLL